jgi:aerobic-type carbon monoxide dehydrogenase small subunit (CoxS/CutS family)
MMTKRITFTLNHQSISLDVEPQEILLDVLRNRVGVKSPKCGCDRGDCGTCTVILNGKTVRSCLVLAIEADGQIVVTLEGLMQNGQMTPLQESLFKHNSFQCGFCAPGMILSATELLERIPSPSEEQIKEAVAGNLCRCTGYQPILDAIKAVSNSVAPTKAKRAKGARS